MLAETLLERTLDANATDEGTDPSVLGRIGCWVADGVGSRTLVALVRLRHQLISHRGVRTTPLLVEEATALAWDSTGTVIEGAEALALLQPPPFADPPSHVRDRAVTQALTLLSARISELEAFAERRADALLKDHRRVREAADARGSYAVKALLPGDVVGLFVLLPRVS